MVKNVDFNMLSSKVSLFAAFWHFSAAKLNSDETWHLKIVSRKQIFSLLLHKLQSVNFYFVPGHGIYQIHYQLFQIVLSQNAR